MIVTKTFRFYAIDTAGNEEIPQLQTYFLDKSASAVNGKMIFMGGLLNGAALLEFLQFDTDTRILQALSVSLSSQRGWGGTAGVGNGTIGDFIGGYEIYALNVMDSYNYAADTFTESLTSLGSLAVAAAAGNSVSGLIIGGLSQVNAGTSFAMTTISKHNHGHLTFSTTSNLDTKRYGGAATCDGSTVFYFGGNTAAQSPVNAILKILISTSDCQTSSKALVVPRRYAPAIGVVTQSMVFCGDYGVTSSAPLDSYEIYYHSTETQALRTTLSTVAAKACGAASNHVFGIFLGGLSVNSQNVTEYNYAADTFNVQVSLTGTNFGQAGTSNVNNGVIT